MALTHLRTKQKFNMVNAIKLPVFKGVESAEPEQFSFVVRVVWEAHGVMDDNIKKATLVSTLQDRSLTWYIKYFRNYHNARIAEIWDALKKQFSQPKSETQSIIGFKEIVMLPCETPWDLDQRLKNVIQEANMTLIDAQYCTWFVAYLTPHLRMVLSQQKISTQAEVLETKMRLHETPIQDPEFGSSTNPHANTKPMLGNEDFETGESAQARSTCGGVVCKV